jgi:AraC family transcriptional regulator
METNQPVARCNAMSARYFPRMSDAWLAPRSGDLDVVISAGKSDAVILSLDRDFFRHRAAEEIGGEGTMPGERSSTADPLLLGVAAALAGDFRAGRIPSRALMESLAVSIVIQLARNPDGGASLRRPASGLAPRKLEQVRGFIEQHLAESLLVEQLAAVVHMSPFHFARLFKLATGISPHAYITARRVERAKELLRNGNLALVEVSAAVGFQTQGHFTEVFHRLAGITPRRFRLANASGPVLGRSDAQVLQQARV